MIIPDGEEEDAAEVQVVEKGEDAVETTTIITAEAVEVVEGEVVEGGAAETTTMTTTIATITAEVVITNIIRIIMDRIISGSLLRTSNFLKRLGLEVLHLNDPLNVYPRKDLLCCGHNILKRPTWTLMVSSCFSHILNVIGSKTIASKRSIIVL
jgi:hypothetical protein